jgi:hypothetical protein
VRADEVIIGRDARAGDIYGKRVYLRDGAKAHNIYGETIVIESHCEISGEIQYTHELRMSDRVQLARAPQRIDKLPS